MDLQKTLLLFLALVAVDGALELPPYVNKCPREPKTLNECATKQASRILEIFSKGDRKYAIPTIDPYQVELIEVEQPGITVKFTKMQILGYSKSVVRNIIIDDSKMEFIIDYVVPMVKCISHCSMDANLRVIRIKGEGNSEFDIFNATGRWKASWTKEKHADGLEYMKLLDAQDTIEPAKMVFQFDNLINNDKNIGTAVNNLLNENWRDIYEEVKPAVSKALANLLKGTLSGFTERVPLVNMFST